MAHVRCPLSRWVLGSLRSRSVHGPRGNYIAGNDARKRQEEGNLKLGEIVLVYRDRRLLFFREISPFLIPSMDPN